MVSLDHLILDYVYICEKRGEILDFGEFIELWTTANEIAEETSPDAREAVLAGILPEPE